MPESQVERDAMLLHLVGAAVRSAETCHLTAVGGGEACRAPAVALRCDGCFTDAVCDVHAQRAREHGARVIFRPAETGSPS